jgi:hypothetical protein
VSYDHLTRSDWRRQTDALKEAFIAARLFTHLGERVVLVDGLIQDQVKRRAVGAPGGVKQFFNRRFHDLGFKYRRMIFFDTKSSKLMMDKTSRGSGRSKLHFHGVFELPIGWTRGDLERLLGKVFGDAGAVGRRQFHLSKPRWDQHYTHNGVQVTGPLGKIMYSIDHAGTTYKDLDLNRGKRSRKSPASRGRCNRCAHGLARGVPSNFNAAIMLCDTVSKQAGKEAFDAWVKSERALGRSPQYQSAVELIALADKDIALGN